MDDIRREFRQRRRMLANEDKNVSVTAEGIIQPITMVHMQGPFFLFVVCIILSLAIFVGEVARTPFF